MNIRCNGYFCVLILACISWYNVFAAQPKELLKAFFSIKVAEQIEWSNNTTIDQFTVGYFGNNKNQFQTLNDLTKSITFKNRKINLIAINDISEIKQTQILIVDKNQSNVLEELWIKIEKKNILLISVENNDPRFIMINLRYNTTDNTYTFDINKANLIIEGFKINPELLLLGGSEVDVRDLYRKMRTDLGVERKRVRVQAARLDTLKLDIKNSNKLISQFDKKIHFQNEQIANKESRLTTLTNDIGRQKHFFTLKENELKKQNSQHARLKKQTALQKELIEKDKAQLLNLKKEIDETNLVIVKKDKTLDSQLRTMGFQKKKIENRNLILILGTTLFLLVLMLGYVIFRAYKSKKRATVVLEKRVLERTSELEEMNTQLTNEVQVRIKTENNLRLSEESFKEIYNASAEVILVQTIDSGEIVRINETVFDVFGFTESQIIGMTVIDLSANEEPYTFTELSDKIKKVLEIGPQSFIWQARRKNGDLFWVEMVMKSVTLNDEDRILTVIRNIHDKKLLEERLNQSEKLEAIGQLAGGIAHDFNNQLGGIAGYAELLISKTKNTIPIAADYAEKILLSVKRSSDLTQQLLAYARKGKHLSEQTNIHDILSEVTNLLSHSIDKRVTISNDLNAHRSYILGDSTQIQNAILNIALNARDAMPQGGTLHFSTKNTMIDALDTHPQASLNINAEYIQLTIEDTGTGISKEIQKNIFDPFFTTKGEGKGTGMGLAAVYGTIKNHDGTITVYSEEGYGTTFNIYLPIIKNIEKVSIDESTINTEQHGTGTILVAEDDDVVRDVCTCLLEDMNYSVIACEDGSVAVNVFKKRHAELDLVIIDLVMPKMNGRETFLAMQKINPNVPVLIASGYSVNDEVTDLIKRGAKGMIQKPYLQSALQAKILECIK